MKLIIPFVLTSGVVLAAPAKIYAAVGSFKAEILNPILEEMCLDMSKIFCSGENGHKAQYGMYHPGSEDGPCACAELPSEYIVKSHCAELSCPADKPDVHFDITHDNCFCAAKDADSEVNSDRGAELNQLKSAMVSNNLRIQERIDDLKTAFEAWHMMDVDESELMHLTKTINITVSEIRILTTKLQAASNAISQELQSADLKQAAKKRQEPTSTVSSLLTIDTSVPTFVPPPEVDITPALIEQSLNSQLQNEAIADSVIPDFPGGNLTYLVQMDGIVATRIPINASTFLACDGIGSGTPVNIIIVPKYVQDGTPQATVADCMVIAVNMYTPNIITYWIQTAEGTIETVAGSNKVHDIDKINTGGPLALSLRVSANSAKRSLPQPIHYVTPKLWRVVEIDCRELCPDHEHDFIQGLEDYCGCLVDDEDPWLEARGISKPDVGEATMTAEACAAMRCINNDNRPATFNPFTRTCWCQDPVYVEDISTGWVGRVRSLVKKYLV